MSKHSVKGLLSFVKLLHRFQEIERIAHTPSGRRENDVEHSYLLAVAAWYAVESLKLPFDVQKVLEYSLIHDLVEAYAGDTYIFDTKSLRTKKSREEKARLRIKKEFPEFKQLHTAIQTYEKQSDPEAIFIHAFDKLMPVITNYLQKGHTWKEMNVTFASIVKNKRQKTKESREVTDLLEQMFALISKDRKKFFNR